MTVGTLVWPSSTPKFYRKLPFLSVFYFLFVLALWCKSTFLKNTHSVTSVSRGRIVCVCGVCVSSQGLRRVYVGVFFPLCAWKAAKDEVAVMKMAFFPEIKALKRGNKKEEEWKLHLKTFMRDPAIRSAAPWEEKKKKNIRGDTETRVNSRGDVRLFFRLGICFVTESTNLIINFRVDAIFVTNE